MKIKHVFIVFLVVSLLCSMTCVSASDNDKNNTLYHDEISVNIADGSDKLESSINGGKTLDELEKIIENANPGDVINLNNDYYCNQTNATDGIYIFDNVTINGHGHFFDGNGSNMSNLFIAYGNNVVLKNINFINWNLDDYNTVILWGGDNGMIQNCTFENNNAFDGELIDWIGNSGHLYDSTFLKNSANYGSIIYWKANYGLISNCYFSNNSAEEGGSIIWVGKDGLIEKSIFKDNSADNGGAIYWDGLFGTLKNNDFYNNRASNGGAIFCDVSGLNVSECSFNTNFANESAGSIYFAGGDAEIHDSEFISNVADAGGAIFIDNYIVLDVFNSSFISNVADLGGAILVEGELNLHDSIYSNNTANKMGGAIYSDFYAYIVNSTFTKNNAEKGGAIFIEDGKIINSTLSDNTAKISGGALYVDEKLKIENSTFKNNTAVDGSNTIASYDVDSIDIDNLTTFDDSYVQKLIDVYINVSDIVYGDTLNMFIGIFADNKTFDGKIVNITLNNKKYSVKVINNTANISFTKLNVGNYSGYVIFNDYPDHGGGDSYSFNVNKIDTLIFPHYSPIIGVNAFNLSATIDSLNATGKVNFELNGTNYTADVKNGVASVIVDKLIPDSYLINLKYSGDSTHNYSDSVMILIVGEHYPVITAPDVEKYYNGFERFIVTLTDNSASPIANANVKININGVNYTRVTNSEGVASMALGLPSGDYDVTTEFNSSKTYSTVQIKSTVEGSDIVKIFKNGTQYYAKFLDTTGKSLANNTNVTFNVNGVMYTRHTNASGIARLNINLNPGTYVITATNPNSSEMYSNIINVLSPIVENNDLVKYYKNNSQYYIMLLDNKGNPVGANVSATFNINGVFYTRYSNASGYVKLNINLSPGDYIITAEYNGVKASNKIKVLSTLEAEDLSMKYHDGSKFEVKVLDGTGDAIVNANVKFNVNGVFYTRVSDSNGIARLNINLMSGQYIITSSYNTLNISNKITISN